MILNCQSVWINETNNNIPVVTNTAPVMSSSGPTEAQALTPSFSDSSVQKENMVVNSNERNHFGFVQPSMQMILFFFFLMVIIPRLKVLDYKTELQCLFSQTEQKSLTNFMSLMPKINTSTTEAMECLLLISVCTMIFLQVFNLSSALLGGSIFALGIMVALRLLEKNQKPSSELKETLRETETVETPDNNINPALKTLLTIIGLFLVTAGLILVLQKKLPSYLLLISALIIIACFIGGKKLFGNNKEKMEQGYEFGGNFDYHALIANNERMELGDKLESNFDDASIENNESMEREKPIFNDKLDENATILHSLTGTNF